MTTAAKLLTAIAEGHGLSQITDSIWSAKVAGKPAGDVLALVILKPTTIGQSDTKQGTHRSVSFEAARLEPVLDSNQSSELRWLLQKLYEQRTSTGEQQTLHLGIGTEEERRAEVMERLEDWAETEGRTGAELEQLWREHFGIGPDSEWSFGDSGVPGDYRKASFAHLLSFGYEVGAMKTDTPLPSDEREEDETAAAEPREDACQVCSTEGVQLTDGLCDECARNTGTPVAKNDDLAADAG